MRILSTSASQVARGKVGWLRIIPAEWHAKQLLLIASAPGPSGNARSPNGRSTFTDLKPAGRSTAPAGGIANTVASRVKASRVKASGTRASWEDAFTDIAFLLKPQ